MIKCCICGGTIQSGCVCFAAAREIFPDIDESYKESEKERGVKNNGNTKRATS